MLVQGLPIPVIHNAIFQNRAFTLASTRRECRCALALIRLASLGVREIEMYTAMPLPI